MARLKGLEPLTHCLEGSCSIQATGAYNSCRGWDSMSPSAPVPLPVICKTGFWAVDFADGQMIRESNPTRPAWKAGILPLNYTRISTCLEPLACIIITLHKGLSMIFQGEGKFSSPSGYVRGRGSVPGPAKEPTALPGPALPGNEAAPASWPAPRSLPGLGHNGPIAWGNRRGQHFPGRGIGQQLLYGNLIVA